MIPFIVLLLTAALPADADACRVDGASDVAHVTRARAACETARARYAQLFGEPAPHAVVVLRREAGYRTAASGGSAVIAWSYDAAQQEWEHVLPHETMHALMLARHYPDGGFAEHGGYGTPLPDWFEEAVAIFAEPDVARRARLAQATRLPPHMRDLQSILTLPHPATRDPSAFAARDGSRVQPDQLLWAFYPQSIAVLSFVHDAGGADATRELTRRLIADPADASALAGLPGLPLLMSGVIAAWDRWLSALP